jgi:hypothetical protein
MAVSVYGKLETLQVHHKQFRSPCGDDSEQILSVCVLSAIYQYTVASIEFLFHGEA